ncbi:C6 transcription factor [Venturia nashicola]|nr:C6 transcription factor [Venturia nashicola]
MSDDASARSGQKPQQSAFEQFRNERQSDDTSGDETRPACAKCERNGEQCQYDAVIKFRPPTGLPGSRDSTPSGPITLHVESHSEGTVDSTNGRSAGFNAVGARSGNRVSTLGVNQRVNHLTEKDPDVLQHSASLEGHDNQSQPGSANASSPQHTCPSVANVQPTAGNLASNHDQSSSERTAGNVDSRRDNALPNLRPPTENDVQETHAQNYVSRPQADEAWNTQDMSSLAGMVHMDMEMLPNHVISPSVSSGYCIEDGIFEPGSAYQNLFQSLRSHIFRTAQTDQELTESHRISGSGQNHNPASTAIAFGGLTRTIADGSPSHNNATGAHSFELPPAQEYLLWKAWTEEVSIWMFSCSPKAWRRHLDGCASLMQSLDIRGDAGGAEEAVFWCFARMDLCGGLISLERTLIPVEKWTSDAVTEVMVSTYPRSGEFHDYAKMASNIIARAMDLFSYYHAAEGAFGISGADPLRSEAYGKRWRSLFDDIQEWFTTRPKEMLPIMAMSAKDCGSPFPTILYSNAAAISGNQFAHTAAILMLQRKPRDMVLGKVRSVLWHARQICGISLSNDHHGAWTNTVQPIWIAGRLMSHPQEHDAIVRLLKRIEREPAGRLSGE